MNVQPNISIVNKVKTPPDENSSEDFYIVIDGEIEELDDGILLIRGKE